MSTFTGTIAGQVVMEGFMGKSTSALARRLGTRALAIVPALIVQLTHGAAGTYKCALARASDCWRRVHAMVACTHVPV